MHAHTQSIAQQRVQTLFSKAVEVQGLLVHLWGKASHHTLQILSHPSHRALPTLQHWRLQPAVRHWRPTEERWGEGRGLRVDGGLHSEGRSGKSVLLRKWAVPVVRGETRMRGAQVEVEGPLGLRVFAYEAAAREAHVGLGLWTLVLHRIRVSL